MSDIAKRLRNLADSPSPHLYADIREAAVIIATWEDALSGYQDPHEAVCGLCDGPIEKEREESCRKCHLENEVHRMTAEIDQLNDMIDVGDDAIAALAHNMVGDDEDDAGEDDDEDVPGML